MPNDLYTGLYNPDVLSCLANLSNDEVFTPPEVANAMLDLLPQELFEDPNTTFLDPACKSGVFLREIAKRLIKGLEPMIPDLQQRLDHIFHKQLYGIAITELTSLLSRRSLYCSKYPNGAYSVSKFDTAEGNVRFHRIEHRWKDGRCVFCGASKNQYDRDVGLETHAYEFIHTGHPKELWNMKFDVIIGNPPYHLSDGGHGASAVPIYQLFVRQAKKLQPRFLTMVIPARWYVGGRALDDFRDEMLHDDNIRVLHDYPNAGDCFPGVEIKGGICYFLRDRDNGGMCEVHSHIEGKEIISTRNLLEDDMDTFIRNPFAIDILKRVKDKNCCFLSSKLNAGRYFGFHTKVDWITNNNGKLQTADGQSAYPVTKERDNKHTIKVYIAHGQCWISRNNVTRNATDIDKYKVIIPEAGNPGSTIIGKPKISEPGSCSSNTYIVMVLDGDENEANNVLSYLKTQFVRFLVSLRTTTQHMAPKAYAFVPIQDFSKPWTDEELYAKYGLTDEEIAFIESMIKPME